MQLGNFAPYCPSATKAPYKQRDAHYSGQSLHVCHGQHVSCFFWGRAAEIRRTRRRISPRRRRAWRANCTCAKAASRCNGLAVTVWKFGLDALIRSRIGLRTQRTPPRCRPCRDNSREAIWNFICFQPPCFCQAGLLQTAWGYEPAGKPARSKIATEVTARDLIECFFWLHVALRRTRPGPTVKCLWSKYPSVSEWLMNIQWSSAVLQPWGCFDVTGRRRFDQMAAKQRRKPALEFKAPAPLAWPWQAPGATSRPGSESYKKAWCVALQITRQESGWFNMI